MKKLYFFSLLALASVTGANAQNDTLLWENFQGTIYYTAGYPNGVLGDTSWYNYDADGFPDANARPQDWFFVLPFADPDLEVAPGDTNYAFGSSSWHQSVAQADNWYILPSVQIVDNQAVLKFKSATRQTPYYLDGFEVLLSTATNDLADFTTTLYRAAEYTAGNSSSGGNFAAYTFAPSGAWIQGWNGSALVPSEIDTSVSTFTAPNVDSARFEGVLTTHTIGLGAYSGQSVYVAFHHNSNDDNLISIDDILITGTAVGIEEHKFNIGLKAYPNPATEFVQLSFEMEASSNVSVELFDVLGKKIATQNLGNVSGKQQYRLNVSSLPNGTYNVVVNTTEGKANLSFIKQ